MIADLGYRGERQTDVTVDAVGRCSKLAGAIAVSYLDVRDGRPGERPGVVSAASVLRPWITV